MIDTGDAVDYQEPQDNQLIFPSIIDRPGPFIECLMINISDDAEVEPPETFFYGLEFASEQDPRLLSVANLTIGDNGVADIVILDNDVPGRPVPTLTRTPCV